MVLTEGVIELFSHRDHGTSRIVSEFVVGESNDETQTECNEHLRSCMDAASDAPTPEAAVLDSAIGSFDSSSAVVRLIQR